MKMSLSTTAAQKRGLGSSTGHITQKYWASSLSKGSLMDSNTYKYHHNSPSYAIPDVYILTL